MKFSRIWMETPLILDAQGRSIGEQKPQHKWDKIDNEGNKTNARAL